MKKRNFENRDHLVFVLFLVGIFGLSLLGACASKRARPVQGPPAPVAGPTQPTPAVPMGPNPPPVTTSPVYGPVQQPGPPPGTPNVSGARPHVTLVLGGAGVASFATVGLLKRLQEEDVTVDGIVATGWPALFSLAYGFTRSVHDLEWFAMRLQPGDFNSGSFFELGSANASRISPLIQRTLSAASLEASRVPVTLALPVGGDVVSQGDWRSPLSKSLAFPGVFRPASGGNVPPKVTAFDVETAKRNAKNIVVVDMYEDYLRALRGGGAQGYARSLRRSLKSELGSTDFSAKISLGRPPGDFAAKRLAIMAGYREGTRLARALRRHAMP